MPFHPEMNGHMIINLLSSISSLLSVSNAKGAGDNPCAPLALRFYRVNAAYCIATSWAYRSASAAVLALMVSWQASTQGALSSTSTTFTPCAASFS